MENNNEMLLDNEGRIYSEKWLKICTYGGVIGAIAYIAPECGSPKASSRTLEDLSPVIEVVSYIGNIIFTVIEAILLFLITRKMKFEGIEKPSSPLIYALIAWSILSTLGELFYWDDKIGLVSLGLMLVIGWKFCSTQSTKMIGISMLLLPVGALISGLVANSDNHNRWMAILTALPFVAAAGFYLEACMRFLTDKNREIAK